MFRKGFHYWRFVKRITIYAAVSFILFIVICNIWLVLSTKNQVYSSAEVAPHRSVALVLGTSRKLSDGRTNPYFENRMQTAFDLYQAGKVDYIIVSGDNRSRYYNEPLEMRKALIAKGIPAGIITLDYAGLRTLDSIVRCKEIFGQESIVIITQSFHSYRSLFISNHYEMDAIAVVANNPGAWQSLQVVTREVLARPLAILDLYLFNTSPRFLGDKEELNRL